VPDAPFDALLDAMKKAAGVLRDADVPFLLGGGLASWARGGPPTEHDVDFAIPQRDVDRAVKAFEDRGWRTERPPEGWLVKAWVDGVLVDLMFHPSGLPIDEDVVDAAEELQVHATPMKVMSADDILVTKLLSLTEHELDYDSVLEIARALREQIDWPSLRDRTKDSPYAAAFFTLVDELGVSAA
jgi:hypothetical protein